MGEGEVVWVNRCFHQIPSEKSTGKHHKITPAERGLMVLHRLYIGM
jgi:hypothetical protein